MNKNVITKIIKMIVFSIMYEMEIIRMMALVHSKNYKKY